ncbi:hypothetical protein DFJ74DRAFT_767524 [Hyaloraphidium curvatum]|nr:hypothetical protein DFJ74DRAFT_767524 [Hyaloraphidium curvatum]
MPALRRSPRSAVVAVFVGARRVVCDVAQGELFFAAAKRAAWVNDVPHDAQAALEDALREAVLARQAPGAAGGVSASPPRLTAIQKQIRVQDIADAFARGRAPPGGTAPADAFPAAYHALANSPAPHVFDTLLFVERELARPVADLLAARDAALADLAARHREELPANAVGAAGSAQGMDAPGAVASRHAEEMAAVMDAFASALADLDASQRRRFRALVSALHAEYARAVGPERGSDAERDAVARLASADPEFGRRMVLRAMDASQFGAAEGRLRDLGTSDDAGMLPVSRRGSSVPTVQMQSLDEIADASDEEEGTEGEGSQPPRRSLDGSASADFSASGDHLSERDADDADTAAETAASRSAVSRSPSPGPPPAPAPQPSPPTGPEDRELARLTAELASMGFDPPLAQAALELSSRDPDRAVALLLESPDRVRAHAEDRARLAAALRAPQPSRPAAPPAPPPVPDKPDPKSRSVSTSSLAKWRESLQARRSQPSLVAPAASKPSPPPPPSKPAPPPSPAKPAPAPPKPATPEPRSPSREQRPPSRGADEGTANPLRRLGTLFGKPGTAAAGGGTKKGKEKEGGKEEEAWFVWEPDLSESFTVWQGTHARTMYNLRLAVLPTDNPFRPPRPAEDLPLRAQTAQSLYSPSPSAAAVVVTRSELASWRVAARLAPRTSTILGTGILRTIFRASQATTDPHFPPLASQLARAESDLDPDTFASLAEGDVVLARHGNLPLVHITFLLVMDERAHPSLGGTPELTPRTPLVAGYRNLLRVAASLGVGALHVPALLLPDAHLAAPVDYAAMLRRFEQVCRTTRSFMAEHARGAAAEGGEKRSWTFVLPPARGGKGWEGRFGAFRDRFAEVFRA